MKQNSLDEMMLKNYITLLIKKISCTLVNPPKSAFGLTNWNFSDLESR